ncbi:MAG: SDR family oxidoreductase [Novosphingobium sp.]
MVGNPGAAADASSKAAIRGNAIHPAAVLTEMWEAMPGEGPDRAEQMAALLAATPLRRFGRAEEIAALAVLLALDEAGQCHRRRVTGSELSIAGGMRAGSAASPS